MSITYPQYPWNEGDRLFASALNAAVANGPYLATAGYVNVINFGADPTGVADSSTAFCNALAVAGKGVYAPTGTYHIRCQLVVGPNQVLFGDSRGSTILSVGLDFDPTATGVISLTGRELNAPTVRDLQIAFVQTTTQGVRANFKTLANGGNLTTGIMYPPAIIITSANRFRLSNLAVSGAWDGIINSAGNVGGIGGYFIDNIECGALNVGLWIDNQFDTGHIKSWHSWNFGLGNAPVFNGVYLDGNTYAARFGVNANAQAVMIEDFFTLEAKISIDNNNSWVHFVNLALDGNGARVIINDCIWVMMTNVYTSAGVNANPQFDMRGSGFCFITTQLGGGWINQTNGSLVLSNITPGAQDTTHSLINQTGGNLYIRDSYLVAPVGLGPWTTVPVVNSTAGTIAFVNNIISPMAAGSTQPGLKCLDQATNTVIGNVFNGWGYAQGVNTVGGTSGKVKVAGVDIDGAAGTYRLFEAFTSGLSRWQFGADLTPETGSNAGSDFVIVNFGDTGFPIGQPPFAIHRATGGIWLKLLPGTPSYANDAAASAGGVPIGQLYRNGSAVMCRIT